MASSISLKPNIILSPFTRSSSPRFHRSRFAGGFSDQRPSFRGRTLVAQFGFRPGSFPDPGDSLDSLRELLTRAESILYTIADAAVSSSDSVDAVTSTTTGQNNDWLSGITNYMETVLKVLKDGLSTLHVPYAYGFAIILLTVLVKAATFPLTKKQVESAMSMRSLQPQIKAIQERYAGDQERIQLETARLYKLAGINPLAGCLPTLATIPVWIGLYRALSNVADEGLLTEGFFWIPSLAGPTTIASRQNGSGISWLFPFVDGHPPLGWSDTLAYLVLPLLLVISQYVSIQIMQSSQNNDPNMKNSQAVTKFLPLMIGYFSLSVPSGLSLYWLTNNILSTAQQVWLQKFGGARNPVQKFTNLVLKEDRPQVQKSVPELKISKENRDGEKATPEAEGPKPGERFRRLKEEESRRKREREEKLKAEAALAQDGESNTASKEMESGTDAAGRNNGKAESYAVQESTDGLVSVNGRPSGQEDREISVSHESERYQSDENMEKEYTVVTSKDHKPEDKAKRAEE
ncbi:PREDICTED: ALBINO3-like protein 1, chloroplastic [Tarenaya hassleriana]|uniref:ALBINO3-like protein 1, chloroplastic n=1 Tax=Tarenaya hassleriana TaxID=28532 RepID=UPI00053C55E5|nr:PREDICTED: ALBINO3-like protein 1, chloroplastic [Tarenaya hassleriana]